VETPRRRRSVFDAAADRYDRARPDYPERLFDDLVALTGIQPGHRVLEVGCATGKATRSLAERGFRVTCVELGPALAERARASLARFSGVEVVQAAFEEWEPPAGARFDLVAAATSWHWIDPAVKYRRAFDLLRPGGHLAFWSAQHVVPEGGDPFFQGIQDVYDEIGEGMPAGTKFPRLGELAVETDEIEASGLFDIVGVRHLDWEVIYDADAYIDLLETFSGHIAMQPWQRERLYGEIRRRLAERPGGLLRRHWGAVLHVARRRAAGTALAVSPPVAQAVDVVAGSRAEVGRADDQDLEPLRPCLVASPRTGWHAHGVPFPDVDDLVVDLHPPAPAHDHVDLLLRLVRVAVRKAVAGWDALVAQAGFPKLECRSCRAELQVRRAVEVRADVLQVLPDVPARERHGLELYGHRVPAHAGVDLTRRVDALRTP